MFPAADGFVTIAAQQPQFFEEMCNRLAADALLRDPRFADAEGRREHRLYLIRELGEITKRYTKAELMERLGGHIPFGPVMNIADISADPHFAAREMLVEVEQPGASPLTIVGVPVKMTGTPGAVRRRSPYLGEQTRAQLLRAGLSPAEIQALVDARAAVAHGS